jgi:hypothetical protein
MELSYLPLNTSTIDVLADFFNIQFGQVNYLMLFKWNPEELGLYFSFYDNDESPIVEGRLVVYGENLLDNIVDPRVPAIKIIPLDETGAAEITGITIESLKSESVRLYVVEE